MSEIGTKRLVFVTVAGVLLLVGECGFWFNASVGTTAQPIYTVVFLLGGAMLVGGLGVLIMRASTTTFQVGVGLALMLGGGYMLFFQRTSPSQPVHALLELGVFLAGIIVIWLALSTSRRPR
jgi:hypothetical protein